MARPPAIRGPLTRARGARGSGATPGTRVVRHVASAALVVVLAAAGRAQDPPLGSEPPRDADPFASLATNPITADLHFSTDDRSEPVVVALEPPPGGRATT